MMHRQKLNLKMLVVWKMDTKKRVTYCWMVHLLTLVNMGPIFFSAGIVIQHTSYRNKKSLKYKSYLSARSVILRIFAIIEIFESWVTSYTKFRAYVFLYCTIHCSKRCLKCQNQSQNKVCKMWDLIVDWGPFSIQPNSWGNVMGGMHSTFFLIEVGSGNWGALTLKGGTAFVRQPRPPFYTYPAVL